MDLSNVENHKKNLSNVNNYSGKQELGVAQLARNLLALTRITSDQSLNLSLFAFVSLPSLHVRGVSSPTMCECSLPTCAGALIGTSPLGLDNKDTKKF